MGTPHRLNWWQQRLDYSREEECGEVRTMGGITQHGVPYLLTRRQRQSAPDRARRHGRVRARQWRRGQLRRRRRDSQLEAST